MIDADRLWNMHHQMAAFTDPDAPFTRRSFTEHYLQGREWLKRMFNEAGMPAAIDAAGNLIGVFRGTGERNLGIGSHTDTVVSGGRFDGVSGVLSLIECVRCLKDSGFTPEKNIVGIDFLAEEPCDFGSCIGSRLATGNFSEEMFNRRHRETGMTLENAVNQLGGDSSLLAPGRTLFQNFDGFLELHIEQGKVLESNRLDVGLVSGICSVTRYDFTIYGRADHAGNTPLEMRSDALVAAAKIIDSVHETACSLHSEKSYFAATVGRIETYPNGSNIIAERVYLTLDMRSEEDRLVDQGLKRIFLAAEKIAAETKTTFSCRKISRSRPVKSDDNLLAQLEEGAVKLGLRYMKMQSGAGHDAAYMATIMPMAMIFIPCREGRSHTDAEYSSKEQIEKGANLLLHALVALSK